MFAPSPEAFKASVTNCQYKTFRFYPFLIFYMRTSIWKNNQLVDGGHHLADAEEEEASGTHESLNQNV